MQTGEGARIWLVPDAYLGSANQGGTPCSHESVCVLNTSDQTAHLSFMFYFADREPIGPIKVVLGARRCEHIRMDKPEQLAGAVIPRDTIYGIRLESDIPVSAQYSRLDVTQPNYTLMTTIPYFIP